MRRLLRRISVVYSLVIIAFTSHALLGQAHEAPPKLVSSHDYADEAVVYESSLTRVRYENDGTGTREYQARVRIQSDAAVQQFSVLRFTYASGYEKPELVMVRVIKKDGSIVNTPTEAAQDLEAEVTRAAPTYSDQREKHVPVTGLSAGDTLEFHFRTRIVKAMAPGQFWYQDDFEREAISLAEDIQVDVPAGRDVLVKCTGATPVITAQGDRRMYSCKSSHTSRRPKLKQELPMRDDRPHSVQVSSFRSWREVGEWYAGLEQGRTEPTPEIKAKAAELTAHASTDDEKIRALYKYVAQQVRYVGISFGVGRYQPHPAAEVMANAYGDCKDQHTLLASLLQAAGIPSSAVLIGSDHFLDVDVPSPGQFDHLITVIHRPSGDLWLDTTTELAPPGLLVPTLRDKEALLVGDAKSTQLVHTPAAAPFPMKDEFNMKARLNDDGTLTGTAERDTRGDVELLLRLAFRRTPKAQWKDLVQAMSYSAGFAGDVSDFTVSDPDDLDSPFRITYRYNRKDYPDLAHDQTTPPMGMLSLLTIEDGVSPDKPVLLGAPAQFVLRSTMEVPKGMVIFVPKATDLTSMVGEYHAHHEFKDGVLTSERQLTLKSSVVAPSEVGKYREFSKAVMDEQSAFMSLSRASAEAGAAAADGAPGAAQLFAEARHALQRRDLKEGLQKAEELTKLDPKYPQAWLLLGSVQMANGKVDEAITSYKKEIEANPLDSTGRKTLGYSLMSLRRYEEAVPVWQEMMKTDPLDADGPANLGSCLMVLKRYPEAATALQAAVKANPTANLQSQLGYAYLLMGNDDKALPSFQAALESDHSSMLRNNVAYFLADKGTHLDEAARYAEEAVKMDEDSTHNLEIEGAENADLNRTVELGMYWDTLGWVRFRQGKLVEAEQLLSASWKLSQDGVVGEHLGEVYEKQGKAEAAAHVYALAAAAGRDGESHASEHLAKLVPLAARRSEIMSKAAPELVEERFIKVPLKLAKDGRGDFLLVVTSGKIEQAKLVSGPWELQPGEGALKKLHWSEPVPPDHAVKLLRRGTLDCIANSECQLVLKLPSDVHSVN